MKKNLLKDLSASTIQFLLNYLCGLLIFFLTSRHLDKPDFGELNWSLAIFIFVTTILSLRLEQIIVRKVAAGDDASRMLTVFTIHIFFGGLLFYVLLLIGSFVFPAFFETHNLLMVLAISQLLSFFSLPFKQLANGKEKFAALAIMSVSSNVIRSVLLLYTIVFSTLTIRDVLLIYIISSFLELVISFLIVRFGMRVSFGAQWQLKDYTTLLRESLPQIGSVFFNAAIARMDWILLGFFTTPVIVAEYSFVYKVFELCPLPLLVLSPVLLSRFSRFLAGKDEAALEEKKSDVDLLVRWQLMTACFIALVLNIIWIPLADGISGGKYGEVNRYTFLVLSICLPLQFMNNLFWTVHFSLNHLGRIFRITAVTCVVMFACNIILIPLYGGVGAAIGYLIGLTAEYVQYGSQTSVTKLRSSWQNLILCIAGAAISGLLVGYFLENVWMRLIAGILLFGILMPVTRQFKLNDVAFVKQLFRLK